MFDAYITVFHGQIPMFDGYITIFHGQIPMFDAYITIFHGQSLCLMLTSQFVMVKSLCLMVTSPFFMVKSLCLMLTSQFFMVKSLCLMAFYGDVGSFLREATQEMTEAKALLGMAKVLGAKEEMSAARNLAVWGCRGLQGAAGWSSELSLARLVGACKKVQFHYGFCW